jgi:DNA-binding response OmpR family regulator
MPAPKILIVEDEFLIRLTLAEALTDDGFDVAEAATGDEALAMMVADAAYDLLLTDVQLPGTLDGIALARAARRHVPSLQVIFMTGRPDTLVDTVQMDRDAFIAKPYLPSEVCAAARRMTGR